ncbi:MAG: peptidylprolyl isomerase [Bdellovibrionales bacterium]|nr:peptidylprolyl isomerase [Bdellovibrionales bacterium]
MKSAIHCFGMVLLACVLLGLPSASATAQESKLPFRPVRNPAELPATALVETSKGPFEIEFYREEAPVTVQNFVHLAKSGFYNGLTFHRYVPGFVIQGGDPKGDGSGGPGYTIPGEYSNLEHRRGTVAMARHSAQVNPERRSNGSQFYISLRRAAHLDGLYAVFARVINGMDVVEELRPSDKILRVMLPR